MQNRTHSRKLSSSCNLLLALVFVLLAVSCGSRGSYNKSADVRWEGWTPADTILFEVQVADSIKRGEGQKLLKDERYNLALSFRYSKRYRYTTIPVHVIIGAKRYTVTPQTEDHNTWSDFTQSEYYVPSIPVSFSDTGTQIVKVFPDTTLTQIYSVGIDLR